MVRPGTFALLRLCGLGGEGGEPIRLGTIHRISLSESESKS